MTQCQNCEAAVTARFARVFGDNHGQVHCCLECAPNADLKAGLGANPSRDRMEAVTQ